MKDFPMPLNLNVGYRPAGHAGFLSVAHALLALPEGPVLKLGGYGEAGLSAKIDARFVVLTVRHLLVPEHVKELLGTCARLQMPQRILGRESANLLTITKS